MRWENTIRDRLNTYESPLPESGFDSLFGNTSVSRQKKRSGYGPLLRYLVPGVAAICLIVLLIYRPADHPAHQTIRTSISLDSHITVQERVEIKNIPPIAEGRITDRNTRTATKGSPQSVDDYSQDDIKAEELIAKNGVADMGLRTEISSKESDSLLFTGGLDNKSISSKDFDIKIMGIGTSGLIAAGFLLNIVPDILPSGGSSSPAEPITPTPSPRHYLPFKVGISAGIPLTPRLRITTGLNYSRYSSEIYSPSPKMQRAHFLGIPLRLDGIILDDSRYEIYAGGGFEEAFCLLATKAGDCISHDNSVFSLQGVLGAQWYLSERVTIYIEPSLSWTPFARSFSPENYFTTHPVTVSFPVGFRYNFF